MSEVSTPYRVEIELTELEVRHQEWMKWAIIASKILLAAYTIPHNAEALGIKSLISLPTLGLIVFEITFIWSGLAITEGVIKGEAQSKATWSIFLSTVLIMGLNSVLATALHISDSTGEPIGGGLRFYQTWIASFTPILIISLSGLAVMFSPENIIKRSQWAHKITSTQTALKAQIAHDKLVAKHEAETVQSKLGAEIAKMESERLAVEADQAIYQAELDADTEARMTISQQFGREMKKKIKSADFRTQIAEDANKKVNKLVRDIRNLTGKK